MRSPSVSICVPTYQGEAHLRECLESIAAQTHRTFEVVVVDDASSDGSVRIVSEFAKCDDRFRVYRNPTRLGLVGNWNRCLELSRGEWIKLLFQDDLMAPDCVEQLVNGCIRFRRPLAFCRRHLLFEDQIATVTRDIYLSHDSILDEIYEGKDELSPEAFASAYSERPGWNLVGEPTATLFHRSMVERFGAFEAGLVQLCDAEYWTRLASNVGIVHLPERLATFRVHSASTTSNNSANQNFRMQSVDPLILEYLVLRTPYYRKLRKVMFRKRGRCTVWFEFFDSVYRFWKSSSAVFTPLSGPDPDRKDEWKNVFLMYPGLIAVAIIGFASALIRSLCRRLIRCLAG